MSREENLLEEVRQPSDDGLTFTRFNNVKSGATFFGFSNLKGFKCFSWNMHLVLIM